MMDQFILIFIAIFGFVIMVECLYQLQKMHGLFTSPLKQKKTKANPFNIRERKAHRDCVLCMDKLISGVVICGDCDSIYHVECLEELAGGSCPTIGCKKNKTKNRA